MAKYIDKATAAIESIIVKTGEVLMALSNSRPPKTPARIMTSI